jgi:hypothetical protein
MPIFSLRLTGVVVRKSYRRIAVCCILVSTYLAARRLLCSAWSTQQHCERHSGRLVGLPRQSGVMTSVKIHYGVRGNGASLKDAFSGRNFHVGTQQKARRDDSDR